MTHLNVFAARVAALGLLVSAALSAQTIVGGYSGDSGVSPSVARLPGAHPAGPDVIVHGPKTPPPHNPHQPDEAAQTAAGPLIAATGGVSFDGMSVYNGGYIPSDNNIAVGPNHVVEVVNAAYAVYSKSGALLLGPKSLGSLWTALSGSSCANQSGDTVVQYDRLADRWMITQMGSLSSPFSECVAVSQTNDPATTAYNLYQFPFQTNMNDYPKWGVWPTATNGAYLATYNLFANGANFVGADICAYDRTAMLAGAASAGYVCATGISGASFLPIDLDGPTPPPDGTPAYFMDLFGSSLGVYRMSPDFSQNPPTATLSSFSTISVAGYSQAASSPQPGTTQVLDSLSDRAMFRLAYRRFSAYDSVVLNHAIVAGSGPNSGVRWYELRGSAGGPFSLYQQGTYAPDTDYRWMGSAAQDQAGDIAIGYSVSSGSTYPSVRYTGRVPADPLGTMETEGVIINGAGSQTGYTRWGDYSSLRVDPADDCTFWYVNEYYPSTSSYGWYTRIGSFKFNNCGGNPSFALNASPTAQTVNAGSNAVSSIGFTPLNSYSGTVNLSIPAGGCPAGVTCGLGSGSISGSQTSTLTVGTSTAGVYTVTVLGADSVNSALTSSTSFKVTAVSPDFTISANPTSFSVTQGSPKTSTITVAALNGFSGTVALSYGSTCPASATCSLSSGSVNGSGTSTLTVTPSTSTPPGTYTVTVTGTSGALIHPVNVSVTVTALTGFTTPATLSLSVSRNSNNSVAVNVGAVGAPIPVTLSISGLPGGASATFTPNPVNSGSSSTLKITAKKNTRPGTYHPTITGKNGTTTHTTALTLTVN